MFGESPRLAEHAAALLGRGRQHHARAKKAHETAALDAEILRHDHDERIALLRADHCKRDTGIAAGRLDDGLAGVQRPRASASSMMASAMRSLIEPMGLKASSFANNSTPSGARWLMRTTGVRPIVCEILSNSLLTPQSPVSTRCGSGSQRGLVCLGGGIDPEMTGDDCRHGSRGASPGPYGQRQRVQCCGPSESRARCGRQWRVRAPESSFP
jgi:hypothetical protein